jgi:hypothetical protein
MANRSTKHTPPPPVLTCECPGCRWHIARLESLNRQLSADNDRLTTENTRLQREQRAGSRAA